MNEFGQNSLIHDKDLRDNFTKNHKICLENVIFGDNHLNVAS